MRWEQQQAPNMPKNGTSALPATSQIPESYTKQTRGNRQKRPSINASSRGLNLRSRMCI